MEKSLELDRLRLYVLQTLPNEETIISKGDIFTFKFKHYILYIKEPLITCSENTKYKHILINTMIGQLRE